MTRDGSPARDGSTLIVDDNCPPAVIDRYTEEDLDAFGLRGLYTRSCTKLGVRPVEAVLAQLPSKAGEHHQVVALDVSACYLGTRRSNAVVSVVAACPRLTHLNMSRVGMNTAVAKALVQVLRTHTGIVAINLSGNDIGTAVGEMLLRLATEHRRVHTIDASHCLIVQPLLRRIASKTAENHAIRDKFTVPLIPIRVSEEDLAAARLREEEERLRKERAAAEERRLAELLPAWAPAAMQEVHDTLFKHRRHMQNVFSVFKTAQPGDAYISPKNFLRAMKILDVRLLGESNEVRCSEFADLFCAWDRSSDMVNFLAIVSSLRIHATRLTLRDSDTQVDVPRSLIGLTDRIFDSAPSLQRAFEMIDADATGLVATKEAVVGIAALAHAPVADVEQLLALWCGGDETLPEAINYAALLRNITISAGDDEQPPGRFDDMGRSAVRALAAEALPLRQC